ncbi:MAG: Ig-like domain-containing protein [Ginsengibacter sp.]
MKKPFLSMLSIALLMNTAIFAQKKPFLANENTKTFAMLDKAKPQPIESAWYQRAVARIEAAQYLFQRPHEKGKYLAANPKNSLLFEVSPKGYIVKNIATGKNPSEWQTSFMLKSIGRNNQFLESENTVTQVEDNNLHFVNQNFDIEYLNDKNGMRQNFIVKEKPSGEGNLTINLALGNEMNYELKDNHQLLCFTKNGKTKDLLLKYDGLKVWDATGKPIFAFMKLNPKNSLSLVVADQDAVYPLTVDPLNHAPEWTTSADGVLPGILTNLQLQIDALYGLNVAALGDVNGDGFDDVAIGAPAAIDIISGPSTVVGAGAVFVYFGSASGLSTTPSKVLRATTPVANALFGFSIAGGNVTGDSKNDIIIGAPGESYTAKVGGLTPSTATVTAGKVYVFRGEDLSASNPSPLLSIYLNGSTYFNKGVLGVVGSNLSINALFGFSVAVADDMNGDGLGEIVVGSPGYAELALVPVRSGAALVYYSTGLITNTPVKLTAPTSTILGIPLLNTGGLLFGFSVDGVGDYNQDGKPDIVVGAPAGITLNLGNLLGGSAYVYNGNGSGVNTSYGTQLTANASLVGTLANLFGYSVRGVRNTDGKRNGSILIGAPSGNLLSNILGGLRLKAGNVNVFVHKSSPGTSQLPDQQLPSPRGNSLLSILGGQNLSVSALFGASIDNMLDVNCDGINDIIVGEPLSTGVGIINANAIGGAADIFLGKADGTYQTTPFWTVENTVSMDLGINAGSLLGFSVAGARHIRGPLQGVRALVGAPGAALDFGSGLLNLGNTLGTLFSFTAGNNGLGKAYTYGFDNCGVIYNPDVNVTYVNVSVPGNVNTNDVVPSGTSYGTPVADPSNPSPAVIVMFTDGSYTFTASVPGVYLYQVPVCLPGGMGACTLVELKITVLEPTLTTNPPVANTDIAITLEGNPVDIKSLENDHCSNPGCSLNKTSVVIVTNPKHGTALANGVTGDITYTPQAGFTGNDTLFYKVCDNDIPAKCATAMQIITVYANGLANTTLAADDYNQGAKGIDIIGNVKTNDTDPEGNSQTVNAQTVNMPNQGTLVLAADGSYQFTPDPDFTGPIEFSYTTCDDGVPSACASATLHLLIEPTDAVPLTLIKFNYEVKDCAIKLFWTSAQELNVRDYIIESSRDSKTWTAVGKVNSKGSVYQETDYSFAPANPSSGQNFYRLLMTDLDGKFTYSKVIKPFISCLTPVLTIAPNPFTNRIVIHYDANQAGIVYYRLSDGAGKQIVSSKVMVQEGVNTIILNNLSRLSSGIYILTIKTPDKTYNQKIVK